MARIPEVEVERLKREVSLLRLLEGQGHALVKQGKDLACRCPWHAGDDTPSCVVTPASNLWHCFGCDAGGSVIDWTMRWHKVSFRHAVELLLKDHPALSASAETLHVTPGKPGTWTNARPAADFPIDPDDDQRVLDEVIGYYHQTLLASPEALAYLDKRGLHDRSLIERFRLGFANRTLGYRLPRKETAAGAAVRGQLQRIGILRASGHEHFNGSLVIPVRDADGHAVEVYGRKITDNLRKGTALHLYLPGPHRGVFNRDGMEGCAEVILCEALIDALTFIAAGYTNVTSAYGVHGVTDDLLAALPSCGCKRVLLAFDRDAAGDTAAEVLAPKLQAQGFDVFRLPFPKGMDANAYALQVQPASKSLGVVIRSALWMGNGAAPMVTTAMAAIPGETVPASDTPARPSVAGRSPARSSAARNPGSPLAAAVVLDPSPASDAPLLPARALGDAPEPEIATQANEREVTLAFGDRRYRVRGLAKNSSYEVLKVNLLVSSAAGLHVDTFDLYAAKARQVFAKAAASELAVEESVLQRDLGRLLLQLESLQDALIQSALTPKASAGVVIAQADQDAALAFLRDPALIERITADVERTGLVGEPVNAQVAYLAMVSRLLPQPLAILIQSTSAAGKSALMDAVLKLVPDEHRVHYSAMTGQSLFYLGEKDLQHKILAIAEEEGVRQAAYALKLLQSQGELTIASTGKDPHTGLLTTQEYRVQGPVMLCLTTTAIDLDEELLNRCLVLTIDESREQTRAIQTLQRQRRTLAGLLCDADSDAITSLHRNAQRLLRPLKVVNPYADQLTFLDERTRTRRDHAKYLTLIDAIALLHQHQREVRTVEHRGQVIDYVEATPADIALANRLAHEVLGRSLDELPPQTRRLLGGLCGMVAEHMQTQGVERSEVRFTRREVRERSGLSNTQLGVHLERLLAMEYLVAHRGMRGQSYVYELLFDGDTQNAAPHLPGLIDAAAIGAAPTTTASCRGSEGVLSGACRPQNGVDPVGVRLAEMPLAASTDAASSDPTDAVADMAHHRTANGQSHRSAPAPAASSLVAAL